MLRNLKIGQKLVIIFLMISVLPLVAISTFVYHYTKSELQQKTIAALQAVTDSRAAHINHSIQLRQEQAKGLAGAFLLRQLNETGINDPVVIEGIRNDIDATFDDLISLPTSDYQDIDKKSDIKMIGVWDVLGHIIANTNRQLIGQKIPLEYLQNVYKHGTYFVGFQRDPLTGQNFLINLEQIRNWKSGLIVGAVSVYTRAQILDDITTAREGLGKSGETYVVNNEYAMITQSRFINDSILKVKVDTPATRACFNKNIKAPNIYKNYRGVEVLGVHKYLADPQWCLVAEIDAQEAFAPVREFRNRTLVFGGILILIILILSYLASRALTRPILHLHQASQKVAQGDYNSQVPVEGKDEIGSLAMAFNEMSRSLAKFTLELEQKNKALFQNWALTTKQKKELKLVNQELDSFVYTASHDLRAPLRGIASFATFLEEDYKDKLDEQGKDYLNEIRKAATKMNDLIEDLLLLSRISRIKNPYEDVAINDIVNTVRERIKHDIKEKNVDLVISKSLPVVRCDRIKMTEVFQNFINNAIKFSSKNNKQRPRVEVGYVDEGDQHKFFIKDNGIGIDPKYHDQIFGIFKRLHTDKEYEGTGAGLSIIKRVIDDHQGKIWVESEVGHGATFCFTIPKNLENPSQDGGGPQPDGLGQPPKERPQQEK